MLLSVRGPGMAAGASAAWVRDAGCSHHPPQLGAGTWPLACPHSGDRRDLPRGLAVPMTGRIVLCSRAMSWGGAAPGSRPGLVASPRGSQLGRRVSEHPVLGILTAPPQILPCSRASRRHRRLLPPLCILPIFLGAGTLGPSAPRSPRTTWVHPRLMVRRAHAAF